MPRFLPRSRPPMTRGGAACFPSRERMTQPCADAVPATDVRGVYCLREPVNGLWAYYAVTSQGVRLHDPRPAEFGLDAAFVVAGLADELDELDELPITPPPLRLPSDQGPRVLQFLRR